MWQADFLKYDHIIHLAVLTAVHIPFVREEIMYCDYVHFLYVLSFGIRVHACTYGLD